MQLACASMSRLKDQPAARSLSLHGLGGFAAGRVCVPAGREAAEPVWGTALGIRHGRGERGSRSTLLGISFAVRRA